MGQILDLRDGRLCGQRLPRCVLIYDLHLNLPLLSLEVALTHLILSSDASFFCLLVKRLISWIFESCKRS